MTKPSEQEAPEEQLCTYSYPNNRAIRGHDWELAGQWGVLIGVSKCVRCGVVATRAHFPGEQ